MQKNHLELFFFPLNTDFDSIDPRDHKILNSSKLPGNAYVAVSQTILLNGEAVHSSVFWGKSREPMDTC